jgi:glycosyltransferase involved in cell wall biosynthesis
LQADAMTSSFWPTLLFSVTAAIFFGMAMAALRDLRWMQRLPSLQALTGADPGPALTLSKGPASGQTIRCSVVIAARDEEARIEQTVRQLLAQQGVELELLVVDDRSTDGTSKILHRLSQEDARLQVRRVDVLPEGWLGKCHACHVGAGAATGDWILFTDADCWLKPDVLLRAVRVAERERADHVTMSPGTVIESLGARAWHLLFLISLANWFSGVNRDRPKSYLGVGAFNLVRAEAYRQCGGYEALRLTIVDDVKLGLLLRRAGKRTRAYLGVDDVECHWGNTVWGMIKIMEKNYFAVLDFRLGLALMGSLVAFTVLGILVAGLLTGTVAGLAAAFSPFLLTAPGGILARRLRWSWLCALLVPLMMPVFLYSLLNSTFVTIRRGGVRWRETFYPLKVLSAGNVR